MPNYLDRLNDPFFVSCSMLGLISRINFLVFYDKTLYSVSSFMIEFGKTEDTVNRLKTSQQIRNSSHSTELKQNNSSSTANHKFKKFSSCYHHILFS